MIKREEKGKKVTLGDVALAAGVSPMTVSNVVSGKHLLVKLETRAKVEEAIARLNYRPNLSARSLRLSKASSIGMLISDNNPAFLADSFISRTVSGLANYLSSLDFTLDVQGISPERFESATILRKSANDALCVILSGSKQLRRRHIEYLVRLGQPAIIFQEYLVPASKDICLVSQDDLNGGELIGQHLQSKGVKSVLFIRPKTNWVAVELRERGLRQAFMQGKSRVDIETISVLSEGIDDTLKVVKDALSRKVPDAIVAATDLIAAAALKACSLVNIEVPGDTLVTGFNGFELCRYTVPPLTTVQSQSYEMGRRAGELLITRLREGKFSERSVTLPLTLHVSSSTGESPQDI